MLADAMGIRYWFLPSLMFLWCGVWCTSAGKSKLIRFAGLGVLLLMVIGVVRKWTYPPWPESQFGAEVEHFKSLKTGEHMNFSVYDPGGRTMELIKR
jgi:hypothetical protein